MPFGMNWLLQAMHTELETLMDRVLGNLSTAIVLLDEHMAIRFANQAAEHLLQESFAHMKDRCLTDIVANGKDLALIVSAAVSSEQLYTQRKMPLVLPGRDDVTVDVTVTPIMDVRQALIELIPMDRYLRIDRDAAINEHHEVTRQMVRGLAHEIKNPLGGIKGSAQLLQRELQVRESPENADKNPAAGESLDEYTSIIIEETDRLTALVDRMLGPNVVPDKRLINIHEVLERTTRLIELEADAALTVIRDYDPSIPELTIDFDLMQQALLNIARNAMQCLEQTPHPTITVSTRIERQFTINGKRHKVVLRIEIKDNGPGIPEEISEHLFYPMISRRPGGTGLGLTFAQSIVSQHEGMIEFSSEPGETLFSIYIPLE